MHSKHLKNAFRILSAAFLCIFAQLLPLCIAAILTDLNIVLVWLHRKCIGNTMT